MTITIQVWMLILSMADMFMPGVRDVKLVMTNGDAPSIEMVARKNARHWDFFVHEPKAKTEQRLGRMARKGEALTVTLLMGAREMVKTVRLSERIRNYQALDWRLAKAIEFDGNIQFNIKRKANEVAFSQPSGPTYTLTQIPPKVLQRVTMADLALGPVRESGPLRGWRSLKKPLVATAAHSLDAKIENAPTPIARALFILQCLMRNDG
ncbi:MAG: hypothetical protein VX589_16630, partial [Myxococcota bacterium]|nr:hypothetical protein [Myxococcota bacterium]